MADMNRIHSSEDKDFANGLDAQIQADQAQLPSLEQVRSAGSVSISPEMFERMYLAPQNKVSGDLRRTLGNPTPIGLGGFLIAYCPIIFSILKWRGYTGNGAATVGTYFFSGGLLAIIAMILEFILGNTFPAVFFGVFGAYFMAFGATLVPGFNAYDAYMSSSPKNPTMAPPFLSGLAFWNLMMTIFTFYCTICALRVNLLFFLAFFFLALTFMLVAASYWCAIEAGKTQVAENLQTAGGATGFVTMVIGWYLLLALMLTTVDFPVNLPVFDLSHIVPSAEQMRKKKRNNRNDVEKAQ